MDPAREAFAVLQGEILLLSRTVRGQIERAAQAFLERDRALAEEVVERDDYVDNLFRRIEQESVSGICARPGEEDRRRLLILRHVGKHLEHIADAAENLAKQAVYLSAQSAQRLVVPIAEARDIVVTGLEDAIEGYLAEDLASVEWVSRCEAGVDRLYDRAFSEVLGRLNRGHRSPESLITQLLAMKCLERIGDQILNVAESTIYLVTGDNIRIRQYLRMSEVVEGPREAGYDGLDTIWEGRSGVLVSHILADGRDVIFKEGRARKIVEEIASARRWEEIDPGAVPRIYRDEVADGRATVVTEYIHGPLYRDLLLESRGGPDGARTGELLAVLESLWERTLRAEPAPIDYVAQIRTRLPLLYTAHPQFRDLAARPAGGLPPLEEVLDMLERGERAVRPPFSVWIHGDLNNDNIIYDIAAARFRFIDIHRSGHGDYLQDLGVLILSNRRNPALRRGAPKAAEAANAAILAFGRRFAREHGDLQFEPRLELSLGRSSITSARFLGDPSFARELFMGGVEHLTCAAAGLSG